MKTMEVLVVDDHPIFRQGLISIINSHKNYRTVGEASNGIQALELIKTLAPDIVTLDVDMPIMDGFAVLREMGFLIKPKIIVLSMYNEKDVYNEVMDLGAQAYVLKESAREDLLSCLADVCSGKKYASPALFSLSQERMHKLEQKIQFKDTTDILTKSELNILVLIARQQTTVEIANMLFISPKTVENHRANICKKLNLKGQNSLLKWAIEHERFLI